MVRLALAEKAIRMNSSEVAEWDPHRVVAIVVNYRTPKLTAACVNSLLQSREVHPRVVVVDNASSDDSAVQLARIAERSSSVRLLVRDVNDGYTGGNNAGLMLAREMQARYAFILNSDTVVDPDCLRLLVAEVERDTKVALVNPCIHFGDSPDRLWFGGSKFSLWRGRPVHVGFGQDSRQGWSDCRDLPFATGCALLISLHLLHGDPFDASLFAYAEDLDLSLSMRNAGHRLRYVPQAKVLHFEGGSHRDSGGSAMRFYFNTRNLLRVVARHARWYHWLSLAPMLFINVIGRFSVVAIRDRQWGALFAVWRGAWHAVVGGRHEVEKAVLL